MNMDDTAKFLHELDPNLELRVGYRVDGSIKCKLQSVKWGYGTYHKFEVNRDQYNLESFGELDEGILLNAYMILTRKFKNHPNYRD